MTDPLKKIELFKAIASPAYIVASLEHFNEVFLSDPESGFHREGSGYKIF